MTEKEANSLKLEIWREIMRSRGDYVPGNSMGISGAMGNYREPPNPVTTAARAVDAFNALYPTGKRAKR